MLDFDPTAHTLTFRTRNDGPPVALAFARFRRLTLTAPLLPVTPIAGAPVERVPAAAQEREYTLQGHGNSAPLRGRTAGRVETADGMYLFTPVDEEASLQRVFVPRSTYIRCEFGASAEEIAIRRWITSPTELLEAIEFQQRKPVRPLGQSLLELGLLTQYQLDRALARQSANVPLGESLVAAGVISGSDLRTALAHKMGFPLVDLARFPIAAEAVAKLPQRVAEAYRAMPLMINGDQLIVAVDRPSRALKLREVHALAEIKVVAVLAPKLQVLTALERMSSNVWSQHVPERTAFFATTA